MEAIQMKRNCSREEYLKLEAEAEYKSEFYNGEIYAMSGGTRSHSLIGTNVLVAISSQLENSDCEVHGSDLKVSIDAANAFTYPDVSVVCGDPEYTSESQVAVTNPILIVEVLSKGTSAWDRGGKFLRYGKLPSLKEYVLIEQDYRMVEVFQRQPDGNWLLRRFGEAGEMVQLQSLGVEIPLDQVYRRVDFGHAEDPG